MSVLAIVALILVVANIIWGVQGGFAAGSWPFWVNLLGSIVVALIVFFGWFK